MINIILCGGNGSRLWPISRTLMPKQFVRLFDNLSLFQLTVKRNSSICESQFIVSNTEQYFLAMEQLEELNKTDSRYLLEPIGRNTAPAIALACFGLDSEDIVFVTPSDHLIKDENAYRQAILRAKELACDNRLVTFGIKPTFPETGFGYIEVSNLDKEDVKVFHEKPNTQTAIKYLESGNYYWNSGMFMFKVGAFLQELQRYSPKIYDTALHAFKNSMQDSSIKIKYDDMINIPENSIDYAVMEKSDRVKMIASDIGWSDVGSFDALYEELPKDKDGNTIDQEYIPIDSKNNLVYGNKRKIVTVDIENLIVIDTEDALLILKKGSSQKVKNVVDKIKKTSNDLSDIHPTVNRPWGTYTILENAQGYKIKRIEVKPGKRLSLQKHFHRNEHWIVVSGTATVTVGNETIIVCPNESTYIKMGEVHRLSNEGKIPVVLIEAQVGEYTGEDDIIRLDDDFKR